jgi:hypothetical protein
MTYMHDSMCMYVGQHNTAAAAALFASFAQIIALVYVSSQYYGIPASHSATSSDTCITLLQYCAVPVAGSGPWGPAPLLADWPQITTQLPGVPKIR